MAHKPQASKSVRAALAARASSAARLAANRANAQKSTGPITAEGKAHSSQNAVKHGLFSRRTMERLAGRENEALRAEYDAHLAGLFAYWKPEGEQEEKMVDHLADQDWHLANLRQQKDNYLDGLRAEYEFGAHELNPRLLDGVDLFHREEARLERSVNTLYRNLQHLRRWHHTQRGKPVDAEPPTLVLGGSLAHRDAAPPSPLPEVQPEAIPAPEAAPAAVATSPESEMVSPASGSDVQLQPEYQSVAQDPRKQTQKHPDDVASWSNRQDD